MNHTQSIDLHTNESIGLGFALMDKSTSLSGESLRMRSRIMTRETNIGQFGQKVSPIHHFMNGAGALRFSDEELWMILLDLSPDSLPVTGGLCVWVIVLEPSHTSSLVRLLSRSLISAVCLCDKWYPVSITIDCLCPPDEKKALYNGPGGSTLFIVSESN